MHHLFLWVMNTLQQWGYPGIIVLMAMESSIIPIPSELVVPPAAYWASQGTMNLGLVVACATLGCWLGASISYWISRWVGRPLIVRYGRFVLVSEHKLELAEAWTREYGMAGIFFSRLLPVVRHLISIPAGLCRMDFLKFSAMTVVGSAIWCSILAWFGPKVITPEMFQDNARMVAAVKAQMHWIVLLIAVMALSYGIFAWMTRRSRTAT